MDLLAEIHSKLQSLEGHPSREGVRAAIRHVEIAERWLDRGRKEQDEDLFNDVIYRTNQAFEGMLKEAYQVLTGEDSRRLSPHQVEQHLLAEDVFTPRVLDLFKNYRQEWRNPSTHDHSLFFSEQEAILAIVRVSAFATILLDQVIEAINSQREREEIEQRRNQFEFDVSRREAAPFHEDVLVILDLFSEEMMRGDINLTELREVELLGRLSGFIEGLDSSIRITREPTIDEHSRLRPDLVLERETERLLIEMKRAGYRPDRLSRGREQVLQYLAASGLEHGILFIPPLDPSLGMETRTEQVDLAGRTTFIHTVAPPRSDQSESVV